MSRRRGVDRRALGARLVRRAARDPLLATVRAAARGESVAVWLVGGAVRDAALGRPAGDLDLVAGRGAARLVRALARAWRRPGFRFRKRGVTTWRFAVGDRRVDVVDASRRGILRDLARRELTVNAVAFDLGERRLLDPQRGLADLAALRLRAPRPGVLGEDPVRALRLCRFLAQLPGACVERATRAAAAAVASRVGRVPAERVLPELDKLLLGADPARGLAALAELGLRRAVLPELEPLAGSAAGAGRPDVWHHTLAALDASARTRRLPGARRVSAEPDRRALRWALLLHDVAKPETLTWRPDGRPAFHGHENLGARRADALLRRLRAQRGLRRRVVALVRLHLRPGQLAESGATPRALARLARDAGDDLPLLVLHAACDARGSGAADGARRWRRLAPVLAELLARAAPAVPGPPRLVDGHDVMRVLGIAPGPEVGRTLERVRELQSVGRVRTREDALAALAAADLSDPD